MDHAHRQRIQKNFSALVEQTNLTDLLPLLIESGVFSTKLAEEYTNIRNDVKERKIQLYSDIQRRGPEAFDKLVTALNEIGSWDLVRLLKPEETSKGNIQSIRKNKQINRNPTPQGETSTLSVSQPQRILQNVAENIITLAQPIVVRMATAFGTSPDESILCYSMKSKKRGVFFMINNINFIDKGDFRAGAHVDGYNLNEVFKQIGFHKNIIYEDLGAEVMEDELTKLSNSDDLKRTDCLFVVIGSHGKEINGVNYITASDGGLLSINTVLNIFNSKNCPSLHAIPKIFIFQVCRGASFDMGSVKNITTQADGINESAKMPLYADMLIVYSTLPEHKAFRDTCFGSWFIYTLCKVIAEDAHNTHMEGILKKAGKKMDELDHENFIQTPVFENRRFDQYCYLNPGFPVTPTL